MVLVQEYAEGGDLYRLLHKNGGRLAERQAVEMVLQPFLLALHYLHTRGIMHRDIKVGRWCKRFELLKVTVPVLRSPSRLQQPCEVHMECLLAVLYSGICALL